MSLAAATRSETTKQFTTSIWWILAIVLVGYVGLVALGLAFILAAVATGSLGGVNAPPLPGNALPPVLYSVATSFGYVFPLLVGTLMVTSEFRHQTLTPTFLATPRRGVVLTAKVALGVLMGLLFGVLGVLASVVPAAAVLAGFDVDTALDDTDTWALLGRMLAAFVLWTILGIGLGSIVRNQVVAVVLVLAFTQFIEPIARVAGGFVEGLEPFVRVLPGAASDALVGASALTLGSPASAEPLEWWAGGLVLAAYAVALLVLGQLTAFRRDVD